MTRALIYSRVSDDQRNGRSPREQEAECRATCEREGWEVIEALTDSAGASRHSRKARPGWERAKELIADGAIDVLVTWEASRAERKLAGVADLIDLCGAHGVLWSYKGRTYDPAKGSDRFVVGLDGLLAAKEADDTSERVMRATRDGAAKGKPHGRLLYGYQREYALGAGKPELVRQYADPDTAPVVRRIFSEYLAGRGTRTIATGLNADSIPAPKGGKWNDVGVRRVLKNGAYAGQRTRHGELSDTRWKGWEPLVTEAQFDKVQSRLDKMGERQVRQSSNAHLLTGVARCGACGGRMRVVTHKGRGAMYSCRDNHCVGRDLLKLDAYVTRVILERLSRPEVAEELSEESNAEADTARTLADELRARLDDAVAEYTAGRLTAGTLAKIEADLRPRIAEAEREARRALVPLEVEVPSSGIDLWWDSIGDEVQREVVAAYIVSVAVKPMEPGMWRRQFYPELVSIEWR